MRRNTFVAALLLTSVCVATPSLAQTESINPLGLDGDPLHAYNPNPLPPPAPDYVPARHHRHHHRK